MKLKMYAVGDKDEWGCMYWICATSVNGAIALYRTIADEIPDDIRHHIRKMKEDEPFTYYHDGVNKETDTIGNLMKKYCLKPDIFACSEF